jgi:hypothetical protein
MARGWESKAVESQQDAAADRRPSPTAADPAALQRLTERNTLNLARLKALGDLQHACAPAHRAMLEQAVADLDRRIAALDVPR